MKLTLIWLVIATHFIQDNPKYFFGHYRAFWSSRATGTQRNLSQNFSFGQVKVIDAAQAKEITKKVDELKRIFQLYHDSTGTDLSQSKELFLLIFTDPRTSLERTYVWNATHKLYFEEYIDQILGAPSQLRVTLKKIPQVEGSMSRRVVTKDDTLQTLLGQRNLRVLHQLASDHQVIGGETCLGIIYQGWGKGSCFTPVDLQAFEFIHTFRK